MNLELKMLLETIVEMIDMSKGLIPVIEGKTKADAYERIECLGDEVADLIKSQYTLIDIDCGYTDGNGWVDAKAANDYNDLIDVMYRSMGWTLNNEKYARVYISPDHTEFTYNHGQQISGFMTEETKEYIKNYVSLRGIIGDKGAWIPNIETNFGSKFYTSIDTRNLKPITNPIPKPKTETDFGLRSTRDQIIDHLLDGDDYKENVREIIGLYFDREPSSEVEWHKWLIALN